MRHCKPTMIVLVIFVFAGCATQPPAHDAASDLGVLWVKHAAEYQAVSQQVYAQATSDLPHFIDDTSWTALPGQSTHSDLPPAIILDVDETVVSNVDFQLTFVPPFSARKLDDWSSNYHSLAVNGVTSFVAAARAAGVTVFFVTNRPCEPDAENNDPCPLKQTTVDDIRELGIAVDAEHVLLSRERRGWNREKLSRREFIARSHRVIMLLGDDLGDFLPCVRKKIVTPCTIPATAASRAAAVETHQNYWGAGWYILPNPMHGSWTSAR